MNTIQLIIKTIITTVDVLIGVLTFKTDVPDESKKVLLVGILINLVGVWI